MRNARKVIFKYPTGLSGMGGCRVAMPEGARVVHAGLQDNTITLWALVDVARLPVVRMVTVVGTGHDVEGLEDCYQGTVMMDPFVWHVFVNNDTSGS